MPHCGLCRSAEWDSQTRRANPGKHDRFPQNSSPFRSFIVSGRGQIVSDLSSRSAKQSAAPPDRPSAHIDRSLWVVAVIRPSIPSTPTSLPTLSSTIFPSAITKLDPNAFSLPSPQATRRNFKLLSPTILNLGYQAASTLSTG